ncbi:DegT/DnrJ/EryC1/StrS family aminotransferase, partial [Echinicola sediminis]
MSYRVPLFDLNFDEREENAVISVIKSKWISTGPKTHEFEKKFSQMLQVEHALAVSNCTVALHLALQLVGVKEGDEVICPSLTFVATCNAIRYVNAVPVFADITDAATPVVDPEDIARKITKKTKAIVVMHYAGFPCDMEKIMQIAQKHNLRVIEDACHAPLSELNGKKLGTIGDIGCFSFFSNKNISTGEGGMLVTNNPDYFDRAKLLRSHGMTTMSFERAKGHSTAYDVIDLGYNYRMDDIRASIGIVQLDKLEEDIKRRALVRNYYLESLKECKEIIIPFKDHIVFSSNYIFPVVLKDASVEERDEIRNILAEKGIQTSIHYPAVHRFSIYKEFYVDLPKTDELVNKLIT